MQEEDYLQIEDFKIKYGDVLRRHSLLLGKLARHVDTLDTNNCKDMKELFQVLQQQEAQFNALRKEGNSDIIAICNNVTKKQKQEIQEYKRKREEDEHDVNKIKEMKRAKREYKKKHPYKYIAGHTLEMASLILAFLEGKEFLKCRELSKSMLALIHSKKQFWYILNRPAKIYLVEDMKNGNLFPWIRYATLFYSYHEEWNYEHRKELKHLMYKYMPKMKPNSIKEIRDLKLGEYLELNMQFINKALPQLPENSLTSVHLIKYYGSCANVTIDTKFNIRKIQGAKTRDGKRLTSLIQCLHSNDASRLWIDITDKNYCNMSDMSVIYTRLYFTEDIPTNIKNILLVGDSCVEACSTSNSNFYRWILAYPQYNNRGHRFKNYQKLESWYINALNQHIKSHGLHDTSREDNLDDCMENEFDIYFFRGILATAQVVHEAASITQNIRNKYILRFTYCRWYNGLCVDGDSVQYERDFGYFNTKTLLFEELHE
jgi:hypothetical protein